MASPRPTGEVEELRVSMPARPCGLYAHCTAVFALPRSPQPSNSLTHFRTYFRGSRRPRYPSSLSIAPCLCVTGIRYLSPASFLGREVKLRIGERNTCEVSFTNGTHLRSPSLSGHRPQPPPQCPQPSQSVPPTLPGATTLLIFFTID